MTESTALQSELRDHPLMGPLVVTYQAGLETIRKELAESMREGSFDQVESLAHRLAGSGSSYGFPSISRAAKALESAVDDPADRARGHAVLDALLRRARPGKASVREHPPAATSTCSRPGPRWTD